MLSMKTKYAFRALSRLSKEYGKGPIPISVIAESEGIPRRFLENILQELKKMDIVNSLMGKNGGYFLTKAPENISLFPVVQYCEESIGLLDCVSETNPGDCFFCKDITSCKTHSVFADIRDYTIKKLKETTLKNL
ncbi:MAG: Rrf2 family transcriptional regulator [Bacteroidales bacterium]|nr:Rrf2 family transcriptional regulator [Bacteroidales bacterium]